LDQNKVYAPMVNLSYIELGDIANELQIFGGSAKQQRVWAAFTAISAGGSLSSVIYTLGRGISIISKGWATAHWTLKYDL
jgi:hypothetical protein